MIWDKPSMIKKWVNKDVFGKFKGAEGVHEKPKKVAVPKKKVSYVLSAQDKRLVGLALKQSKIYNHYRAKIDKEEILKGNWGESIKINSIIFEGLYMAKGLKNIERQVYLWIIKNTIAEGENKIKLDVDRIANDCRVTAMTVRKGLCGLRDKYMLWIFEYSSDLYIVINPLPDSWNAE
jgi:hypothetical protein